MNAILSFRYWFELAVVFGLCALGNIALEGFAIHESKARRIGKIILGAALAVLISAAGGREWFFVFVGVVLVAIAVIHGWWLPRRGVNGLTAEPRERYFALRGWKGK